MYWTTGGAVTGFCDHLHKTREAAERCRERHRRRCLRQGGYSDRGVFPVRSREDLDDMRNLRLLNWFAFVRRVEQRWQEVD